MHVPICPIVKYAKEEYEMIVAVDRALIVTYFGYWYNAYYRRRW